MQAAQTQSTQTIFYYLWIANYMYSPIESNDSTADYYISTSANDEQFQNFLDRSFKWGIPPNGKDTLEELISIFVNRQISIYGLSTIKTQYVNWLNHTLLLTKGVYELNDVSEWCRNYDIDTACVDLRLEYVYSKSEEPIGVIPFNNNNKAINILSKSNNSYTNGKLSTDFNDNLKIGEPISINNSISNPPKDISPDDIYYMTWLIECVELDDNGEPFAPIFHETISQDYYVPEADYVLNQKSNDIQLLNQIDRFWSLEASKDYPDYASISGYLKELAIKYVHKRCVRAGSQNIHEYFEDWINHTKDLLSVEGDRLSYIVFLYDIDELVRLVRNNLKLYSLVLFKPTERSSTQILKIRLKNFFAQEGKAPIASVIEVDKPQSEVQHITTKHEKFTTELSPYKFSELEKVKCLSKNQQKRLIDFIVESDTPNAVAMLYFLELPKKLKIEFNINKETQYSIVAKALGISERTVKGNFLTVTNPESKEDQYKYPACDRLPNVKENYEDIIKNY